MEQRFLFDGIDVHRAHLGVDEGRELTVQILPHVTDSAIPFLDPALVSARETVNALVCNWLPQHRIFYHDKTPVGSSAKST
jgi:hypothetical protein